ncbi:hypothetical protein [Bifidobacterium platyrrhinorum]|uniref:Uncharacterized protein n=1 Tax=Bifidobacterium platyrrhinorum TaxID=2661628 RepID=A0A6L9SSG4_9BIFI|nr:hypothetical protein [Bifidobacterium platyrrhinorum]NEG55448.1 hypothetical protein [Bifidobacterium platyrrhinorum]
MTRTQGHSPKDISGLWMRLRKDNKTYDVRYLNHNVRRAWALRQTSAGTAWSIAARGNEYEDLLRSMRATLDGKDIDHAWILIPEYAYADMHFMVHIPEAMDAKRVGDLDGLTSMDEGWRLQGADEYYSAKQYPKPYATSEVQADATIEAAYEATWADYEPSAEELDEYYNSLADDFAEPEADTMEIPEVPPTPTGTAVSYATLPTMMRAKDLPQFAGLGSIRAFRSQGRKVAYVAASKGVCVIAYRDRYTPGTDKSLEAEIATHVAKLGFAA